MKENRGRGSRNHLLATIPYAKEASLEFPTSGITNSQRPLYRLRTPETMEKANSIDRYVCAVCSIDQSRVAEAIVSLQDASLHVRRRTNFALRKEIGERGMVDSDSQAVIRRSSIDR